MDEVAPWVRQRRELVRRIGATANRRTARIKRAAATDPEAALALALIVLGALVATSLLFAVR
jgi:hypothetical protein